jgi:hypothetical protein
MKIDTISKNLHKITKDTMFIGNVYIKDGVRSFFPALFEYNIEQFKQIVEVMENGISKTE